VIPTADTWFVDLRKENFRGMLTFRLHKRDLSFKHRPFVHHFHGALNYLAIRQRMTVNGEGKGEWSLLRHCQVYRVNLAAR